MLYVLFFFLPTGNRAIEKKKNRSELCETREENLDDGGRKAEGIYIYMYLQVLHILFDRKTNRMRDCGVNRNVASFNRQRHFGT